jgi:hypothetical protein
MRTAICFIALAAAACFPQPTPAQQEADAAALANCVASDWGKPVAVVAADCTKDSVTVAEDVIADIEAATEIAAEKNAASGRLNPSTFPYLDNPNIMAKVAAKKAAALHGGQ